MEETPSWAPLLLALDKALEDSAEGGNDFALTWRIRVDDGGLQPGVALSPWVQRRGKRGLLGSAKRLGRLHLLLELGPRLSPQDARIAELLPERESYAGRALLESVVGHPRVVLEDAPDRPAQVDRTPVGLLAEWRGPQLRIVPGVEGTALPPALAERVLRARAEEPLFLWDGGRLTLLDVRKELKTALSLIGRSGTLFPPESHAALLSSLARWTTRIPVTMPRSVVGATVAPTLAAVLRLEAQPDGSVHVEVRIRPLTGAGSVTPGVGVRDVHVRIGQHTVHAVRDLNQEEAAARNLVDRLPLLDADPVDDEPYRYAFSGPAGALDLLRTCAAWDTPPELEWIGLPIRSLGMRGPSALRVQLARRNEWFGLLGGLTVEGERVGIARLLDAARRKERYVRVAGGTFVEMSQALTDHLVSLADHLRPHRDGVELGPSGTAFLYALERAGSTVEADAQLRATIDRIEASRGLTVPVPPALKTTLRAYQIVGYQWLAKLSAWGAGGVLADDMGLGKTVQTLALLLHRSALGPAIVIAPTSVAFNWRDEAAAFAPSLQLHLYNEVEDRAEALVKCGPNDVVVVSYSLLVRDVELFRTRRFATAIFDEAQNLKNAGTQRFRAATAVNADLRVALSGTPMENHLGELWSLFAAVFPALLGPWPSFRARFAAPIEKGLDASAAPALVRVIAPFLLRRTKDQVERELPARTEVRVPVSLSEAEWQLYEDTRLAALSDLGRRKTKLKPGERRVKVLAALTRLRMLACHPRLHDPRSSLPSSKLARLLELVDELMAAGQRSLIFSQFTSHLGLVRAAFEERGIAFLYLDGQIPAAERGNLVHSFQRGAAPMFLISLKAGGVGLNLTAASNVVHLDPWWNPAVEDQASDRAHRLGQTRPVTVYRLVAMATIEEQVLALHERKRALVERILGVDGIEAEAASPLPLEELEALLNSRAERYE